MNGYRWAPSDLGPALTRETPVQVVMARSPHRCPLSYGGSSADVIQLPDMAEWRFSRYSSRYLQLCCNCTLGNLTATETRWQVSYPLCQVSNACLKFRKECYHGLQESFLVITFRAQQEIVQRNTKTACQLHCKLNRTSPLAAFNFHDVSSGHVHFLRKLFLCEPLADPQLP